MDNSAVSSKPDSPSVVAVAASAPVAPAPAVPAAAPVAKRPPQLAATAAGAFVIRVLLCVAGGGLIVGFFLPWLTIGQLAELNGPALMGANSQIANLGSGPTGMLLMMVPLLGVGLLMGGLTGHRIAAWVALIAGGAVIGDGLVTLVKLFLDATGTGMWMVIGSAFLSLILGLISLGRGRAS